MLALLGILSGISIIAADLIYCESTLRGQTRPHRTTWLIIFILNLTYLANQLAIGATHSLGLIIGGTAGTLMVFLLSIKKGVGGLSYLDIGVLLGAIFGLVLWKILGTPLASILCDLAVAALATIPTIKKAYLDPRSENSTTWLLGVTGGILASLSVGSWKWKLLLVPVSSIILQFIIYALTIYPRKSSNIAP